MARYLRDQYIQNVSIDINTLTQLNSVFEERLAQLRAEKKTLETSLLATATSGPFLTYIIRFDNKGYRVFSLEELLKYFNQANEIERVISTLESDDAVTSKRINGAYLELGLDSKDLNRCLLSASSDTKDWAEASFASVQEVLAKAKTRNGFARTSWAMLIVQILGVVVGFVISLWFASKIAPNLKIENSFVITFLFILLVFGNIWGFLNQIFMTFIAKVFPSIEFIRPAKAQLHWLLQAFVGTAGIAVVVYIIGGVLSFLTNFFSSLLNH